MIWLARLALRLAGRVGLRWMAAAALGRFLLRRLGRGAVERAAADLEARAHERLPAPAARAVSALPPGVRHAGGSAVVATRAARGVVSGGRRATRATRTGRAQVTARVDTARGTMGRIRHETDASARRLRSRYLDATEGPDAATDALLDLRPVPGPPDPALDGPVADDPHDLVAAPVLPGRRRARTRSPAPTNRPRRGYRPRPRPWDWSGAVRPMLSDRCCQTDAVRPMRTGR